MEEKRIPFSVSTESREPLDSKINKSFVYEQKFIVCFIVHRVDDLNVCWGRDGGGGWGVV